MDNAAADARRDVLAYIRAIIAGNGADATYMAKQALTGADPGEFVFQLSTFAATSVVMLAETFGQSPDELLARAQEAELATQAAGA